MAPSLTNSAPWVHHHLYLCGPPSVGKSTIGEEVARQLDWSFRDLDALVTPSPRSFIQEQGLSAFRTYEYELLAADQSSQIVTALGGGTIEHNKTGPFLQMRGGVVYLRASASYLWPRILERGGLHSLLDPFSFEEFARLVKMREQLYAAASTLTLDLEGSSTAKTIQTLIHLVHYGT